MDVIDIGSGSGCIGVTLGLELSMARITALEVDGPALDVTLKNAQRYQLEIECLLEDVLQLERLPSQYDIMVSNPPYVLEHEQSKMKPNVLDHEPHKALFVPDGDPLLYYNKILSLARKHLKPKGKLYFEINEKFGNEMIRLCDEHQCSYVRLMQDLNRKDRMIMAMFD